MIRVTISQENEDGTTVDLAAIRISRIEPTYDEAEVADYQVEIVHNNIKSTTAINRWVREFPRQSLNVLALVRSALMQLKPKDLELDGDVPGHLARRQRRTLPEIPRWTD